ncbi:uncharacterized protein LOC143024440 [Oratosquilla oratoria]|uniref:uncharacterized protein LOC143024440 n=1 Tax=Oratosquilla oratoria TaxID=337810 RepID=UPI003F75931F
MKAYLVSVVRGFTRPVGFMVLLLTVLSIMVIFKDKSLYLLQPMILQDRSVFRLQFLPKNTSTLRSTSQQEPKAEVLNHGTAEGIKQSVRQFRPLMRSSSSKILWPEDPNCNKYDVDFGFDIPRTVLLSYPRSGNTWTRYLIEAATGIYTGSVYYDRMLKRTDVSLLEYWRSPKPEPVVHRMQGEVAAWNDPAIIVKKTHNPAHVTGKDQVIMLVRNPSSCSLRVHTIRGLLDGLRISHVHVMKCQVGPSRGISKYLLVLAQQLSLFSQEMTQLVHHLGPHICIRLPRHLEGERDRVLVYLRHDRQFKLSHSRHLVLVLFYLLLSTLTLRGSLIQCPNTISKGERPNDSLGTSRTANNNYGVLDPILYNILGTISLACSLRFDGTFQVHPDFEDSMHLMSCISFYNYLVSTSRNLSKFKDNAPASGFSSKRFHKHARCCIEKWQKLASAGLKARRLLPIYYEYLREDPISKLRLIISFLGMEPDEGRLSCLQKHSEGPYKGNQLTIDPYTPKEKLAISKATNFVNASLQKRGFDPLPDYSLYRS